MLTLPSESFLYITVKLTKNTDATGDVNVKLVNNAMDFFFEEVRYELAGVDVDHTKNVSITTTVRNLLSVNRRDVNKLSNAD